jgi:hypothetical protein
VKPKPLSIVGSDHDRLLTLFLGKIAADGPDTCWEWLGAIHPLGYGQWSLKRYGTQRAHRMAYALLVGPLDDVLTIDHLCRNKSCVNPAHLELVTLLENNHRRRLDRRGELCPKGHVFVARGEQRNRRSCKECFNEYQRERLRAKRARDRAARDAAA